MPRCLCAIIIARINQFRSTHFPSCSFLSLFYVFLYFKKLLEILSHDSLDRARLTDIRHVIFLCASVVWPWAQNDSSTRRFSRIPRIDNFFEIHSFHYCGNLANARPLLLKRYAKTRCESRKSQRFIFAQIYYTYHTYDFNAIYVSPDLSSDTTRYQILPWLRVLSNECVRYQWNFTRPSSRNHHRFGDSRFLTSNDENIWNVLCQLLCLRYRLSRVFVNIKIWYDQNSASFVPRLRTESFVMNDVSLRKRYIGSSQIWT